MSNEPEGDAEEPDADTSETVAESDGTDAEETESEGFEYGDFVRLEYVARTVEDDRLIDTTDGDLAEEEGIDDGEREFGPRTIVLGEQHIFDPVEESLVGSVVGDSGTATVPPAEAFGEYDDEELRTVSKDKIPEDDRYPGNRVSIDGDDGFVERIIGGRARVDFNHPLAGDTLEYEWEIVGTVSDREEQASDLLRTFLDIDLDVHFETDTVEEQQVAEDEDNEADDDGPTYETVEVEKEALYIDAQPELTMNQQWMMGKQQISQQLIELLDIDRVVVQEVIEGGGFPGMMGGMGGGGGGLEEALEDADIDADELAEEL
ncbi:MAG: FKBP-type peptidyl-prolyl cis-trans isomerases 2 [halophilic archaeon J07HX64]|jgi:FKBP-type peptidyl-prolyl cis-trans isomerases 2|nr:MAG: FKBP-type peptidyl-prolyl cis-trans isomerases 2 [halophilic archaeon J07HX64]